MKLKIDNESLAREFFEDVVLMGIVATVRQYQLSWQLNQVLGFNFKMSRDYEIQLSKKGRQYFFPIYEFPQPGAYTTHYLYNNHHDGEYLLPEFRHLNFLWLVKGDPLPADELNLLVQSIRLLPTVQLVNEMPHEKIRNKQYLIF